MKKVRCEKCGEIYTKITGGVISNPNDYINVCSKCKLLSIKQIFSKIAQNGFSKKDFLYVIENSETNLTVPDCYYWSDSIEAVCKTVVIVN